MELIEVFGEPKFTRVKRPKKVTIAKKHYEAIHSWITSLMSVENEMSLKTLIDAGEQQLDLPKSNLSWLIVLVKNDMASRGQIKVEIDDDRNQVIRLSRKH